MPGNPLEDAMNEFEKVRRDLERLFGYPAGSFNPANMFFQDAERVSRALGEGFRLMQDIIGPQELIDRIEALHPDQASIRLQQAARDVMNLSRRIGEIRLPPSDHYGRRY
jgi:hypothetical protein